jgi:1-acyl-sn-glycerol-3-phosphate acyltransferase
MTARWRLLTVPLRLLYALYAWPLFLLLALGALVPLSLMASLPARRRLIRSVAGLALRLGGLRLTVQDAERLPAACVVVANHASYLDGVVLAAVLPPHFGFVIKREMRAVPAAGWLLERIGAYFVARNNGAGSARDVLRVMRGASSGEALAFFPEGTFRHEPGLLRFHTGAFAAAERAGVPVVPVVIHGTRRCLAPRSILPWPGRIQVEVLAPIPVPAGHHDGAAAMRDAARAAFLARLDLPDLAA